MFLKSTAAAAGVAALGGWAWPEGEQSDAVRLHRHSGTDVVVYGATVAGIAAAVEVARLGGRALLIAETSHVGGVTAAGLTATDIKEPRTVGGIAREFYREVFDHYRSGSAFRSETRAQYLDRLGDRVFGGVDEGLAMQWVFEPRVAGQILRRMIDAAGVELVTDGRVASASMDGGRIRSIVDHRGRRFSAQVFVDASYGGDLLALAGVSSVVGREATDVYGETLAGFRPGERLHVDSRGLPLVEPSMDRRAGGGDGLVQAYCYRLTLTDDPANQLPIERPADFDPALFECLARRLQGPRPPTLGEVMTFTPMPNRKTDTNGLDLVGASHGWANGDRAQRASIEEMHRSYSLGALWFLANDERVPASMRREMGRWGLAADEYPDSSGFPPQMYVREARRMVGGYVVTEADCRGDRAAGVPVALGSYAMDCHVVSHIADRGRLREEGAFYEVEFDPYPIDFQALCPRLDECVNLLVPVCCSASHVAYSSMRMEPVFMMLGQSAGVAAALAIDSGRDVQHVDTGRLRRTLEQRGQVLA